MPRCPNPIQRHSCGILVKLTAALLAGACLATLAGAAQSNAAAAGARATIVNVERTDLGEILVDGSGRTLYLFTRDRHGKDVCAKVPGCLETWPALTTTHRPVVGPNVKASLLGTIELHGRVRQVTYAGHPLYTYAHDFEGRSTYNIGSDEYGGTWDAVLATGEPVD